MVKCMNEALLHNASINICGCLKTGEMIYLNWIIYYQWNGAPNSSEDEQQRNLLCDLLFSITEQELF